MHNNLKAAGFRGLAYKQAMWKAACSTTEGEFAEKMKELKDLSEGAWEWFSDKPPEQWCKAYFSETPKCDMLLNNVCESFNSVILDARDKAIITMSEWVREHMMKRMQRNRDRASARWKGRLCPRINKILERTSEKVPDRVPIKSSSRFYQVRYFYGGQYKIDLEKRECSCRSWQLTGIPCAHALSAIARERLEPAEFVDKCYEVATYMRAYEHPIMPVSYDTLWGDSVYIPPLPPDFGKKRRPGRPPMNRRLEEGETQNKTKRVGRRPKVKLQKMRRQQKTVKCGKCGQIGHNATSCVIEAPIADSIGAQEGGLDPEVNADENAQTEAAESQGVPVDRSPVRVPKRRGRPKKVVEQSNTSNKRPRADNMNPHEIAPPRPIVGEQDQQGSGLQPEVNTQESQVTTASWLKTRQAPSRPGPTMPQQLQMGQTQLQTRVQIRAPPPFATGQFSYIRTEPIRTRNDNNIVIEGGQKYLNLASQTTKPNDKGKKKA